jgi:hypothetical protein
LNFISWFFEYSIGTIFVIDAVCIVVMAIWLIVSRSRGKKIEIIFSWNGLILILSAFTLLIYNPFLSLRNGYAYLKWHGKVYYSESPKEYVFLVILEFIPAFLIFIGITYGIWKSVRGRRFKAERLDK